ncbi:MAG: hypothetical protein ABI597_11780 [Gammaproteobacteria bacterium]
MSEYRVCKIALEHSQSIQNLKFDNKEDAEHYAKNHSILDDDHMYDVQKNDKGEFATIKSYLKGDTV